MFMTSQHLIAIQLVIVAILCGILRPALCKAQAGENKLPNADSSRKEIPPRGQCPVQANDDTYRYNAGSFAAIIAQVTDGSRGNYNIIRLNLRFENLTDHPLRLAYHS